MKKVLSKYNILIDSLSKTLYFKIMILLSFFIILYGFSCGNSPEKDFVFSILLSYSTNYFNMIFFLLLLLNSINIYYVVKKNYNYLIRLENRNNYIKNLVSVNFIFNMLWCCIIFILILSCNILFRLQDFNIISSIVNYNVSNIVYGCFYLFRYYIFSLLISTIFILFLAKYNERKSYIFMLIFVFGFLILRESSEIISTFNILPWKYYLLINYSSFIMEASYSLLYCVILGLIAIFLYKENISCTKFKFKTGYFLLNDFEYLIKKNKMLLFICFFLPLLISFIVNYDSATGSFVLNTALGLNVEKGNPDILSFLWYCINIFSCIYFFVNSFVKDYSNLANIYLRYNFKIYYFIKSISNIFLICLLKIIQYSFVYIMVKFIMNKQFNGIAIIFIKDLSLTLFLGFLVLLFYIIYKIFDKCKFIIGLVVLICFYVFIINPLNISKINYILFDVGIVFIILISNYIIVKNNKKVIQEIGGV